MNLDLTSQPRIKREVQLAGHDLHHGDVAGVAHLLRGQFKGAFAGLNVREFDFRVDVIGL